MTFISYAQNFEDVMLWRALKHVENGFYIDVGANDPTIDSVTKAFYECGWNGINIEPLPSHHADLQDERPRDVNLQCAAGSVHGEINLWECDVRGWATADETVVALHSANGHVGVFHKVPVLPLSEICATNVKGEIHFLKIDVEGFEKSVIEGMDFSHFRPWILVVEATRPNSTEEVHHEWEGIVLSNNYHLAYTDGLNRFYVASEHYELLAALRYPPNVFDGFVHAKQLNSELRAEQAEAKAEQAEAALEAVRLELNQIKQSNHFHRQLAEARQQQFLVIQNSISWKITKPLRAFKRMAGRDFSLLRELPKRFRAWIQRIPSAPKAYAIVKQPIEHGIRFVVQRPRFKRLGMFLLKPLPTIEARLKEKRVAQVRSDFMIQSLNLKSSAGYEHNYQQPKAVNVLSLISADKSSLTVDEILFCIRVELAEMHKEKRSDF